MADHVGEEFDAVVSSVTKFGMFVELPNTVEGLIHISEINDDYYVFVEKQMALVGRKTKQTYRRKNGDKRGKRPFKRQNNNNRRDYKRDKPRLGDRNGGGRKPFYKKRREQKK